MADPNDEFSSCAFCGRSILRGERVSAYRTPEGEEADVCALCKERAEASGWVPAALAGEMSVGSGSRRRGRINLRELLPRRPAPDAGRASEPAPEAEPPGQAETETETETEPEPPPPPPGPVEAFNESEEARKVAGLIRSLGDPQVTIRDGGGTHLITVAWELSWYQWRVEDWEVREVAKGSEISELADEDREWNGGVGEDGKLRVG